MAEYNADADIYEYCGDGFVGWGFGRKNIKSVIDSISAADVTPVVRCKDCKYSRPLNKSEKERFVEGVLMCTNSEVSEYGITDVWDTNSCSYGKRKD